MGFLATNDSDGTHIAKPFHNDYDVQKKSTMT